MPQTNQMWLELLLLNNYENENLLYYTTTYSYRDEIGIEKRNPDRNVNKSFPMFEWECTGDFNKLLNIINGKLISLDYETIKEIEYETICKDFNISIIDDNIEKQLNKYYNSQVVLITYFPERTNPFWNMAYDENKKAFKKVDVIIDGQECGGAAERSCDIDLQRNRFYSIEDGKYCQKLFDEFGKDRVINELEYYLKLNFIPRIGMGWGLTRLINSRKKLINNNYELV